MAFFIVKSNENTCPKRESTLAIVQSCPKNENREYVLQKYLATSQHVSTMLNYWLYILLINSALGTVLIIHWW